MTNPWLKKNPFMSLWLSGANSMLGSARGHTQAAAQQQMTALMNESTKQMMQFWSAALKPVQLPQSSTTAARRAPAKRSRKRR